MIFAPRPAMLLTLAVTLSLAPVVPARAQSVPPGTTVLLQFQERVSTQTAQKGQRVKLAVYSNVTHNGEVVIKEGAPATAVVEAVRKPRRFGRGARLQLALTDVTDVHGNRVPLEKYSGERGTKRKGVAASGAGLIVLGPVGLAAGAFTRGRHVVIEKGARVEGRVAGGS